MTQTQLIPLSRLKHSQLNVRKTGGKAVDELAASIKATGLQQNLGVVHDGAHYGVVFGGRRLRALLALQKAGELPRELSDGIPCRVMSEAQAQEASLAENTVRVAMHPLDQFNGFQALADEGMPEADIAAHFGVTEIVVRQRMRLARVSPKLLTAYGQGDLTLEQLQAFAMTEDQAQQEATWKRVKGSEYGSRPEEIRRALSGTVVGRSDARAVIVGTAAYEAAGGQLRRDLFSEEVFFEDVPLLDRLTSETLEAMADILRGQGWSWVQIGGERPDWNAKRLEGEEHLLTPAEDAELDVLEAKQNRSAADWVRWSNLNEAEFSPEQMAASGVQLRVAYDGLAVEYGLLRDGQEAPPESIQGAGIASSSVSTPATSAPAPVREKQPGDPSFAAVQRLQAEANAIVQLWVAEDANTALQLLAATLASSLYSGMGAPRRWLHIGRQTSGRMSAQLRGVVDAGPLGEQWAKIEETWKAKLPKKPADLLGWALEQPSHVIHSLLAFLITREIDAVDFSPMAREGVVELAQALQVELAADWKPTEEWLRTLPKAVMLAMVEDAAGKRAVGPLANLSKDEIPVRALQLFPEGWLPKALRAPEKERKRKPAKGKKAAAGDIE